MADRIDELKGRIKETAGKATGNERLQAEGKAGAESSRAKRKVKGAVREVGGALKEAAGQLTGDEATEMEGKAGQIRGRAQKAG